MKRKDVSARIRWYLYGIITGSVVTAAGSFMSQELAQFIGG